MIDDITECTMNFWDWEISDKKKFEISATKVF